jgi:hypothetical protein
VSVWTVEEQCVWQIEAETEEEALATYRLAEPSDSVTAVYLRGEEL